MLTLQQTITLVNDSVPSTHEELSMLRSMPFDEFMDTAVRGLVKFSINLAIAIFVFYLGKFIVKKIYNLLHNLMVRREMDLSLMTFVLSMVKIVLYFILIVIVIGIMGIETSSFIALFGAAGVAIGMALSGTLQNFAGGVLILMLKPYKVGDYIETQGYAGFVREIQIFHTIICTYDNKSIILPNGGLSTGSINNWSREDYRRVDWDVSISYGDNVAVARQAILDIFASDERIVTRYVEDDREQRAAEALEAAMNDCVDDDGNPIDCEEAERLAFSKLPWYKKLFKHRRRLQKRLADIQENVNPTQIATTEKLDRSPTVSLSQLGESSVDLKARAWTRTDLYWGVYYDILERIYNELPAAGVSFPFPQMDVHFDKAEDK